MEMPEWKFNPIGRGERQDAVRQSESNGSKAPGLEHWYIKAFCIYSVANTHCATHILYSPLGLYP
jgi:hypothetical protein